MERIIGTGLRLLIAACGLIIGAVCAVAAYHNGVSMDAKLGIWFGLGFAAVVCLSWLMWPAAIWSLHLGNDAQAAACKIAWAPLAIFVAANAVMFVAEHRTEKVGIKTVAIEAYNEAKEEHERLIGELAVIKENPAWIASSGCTAAAYGAKKLCERKAAVEIGIKAAKEKMDGGRPGSADAGAETLAWVLNSDPIKVGKAWPIAIALALEIAASFAMKLALSPWRKPGRQEELEMLAPASPALTQIVQLVRMSPGRTLETSYRQLSAKTGVARSTLYGQLQEWAEQNLIEVRKEGQKTLISLPAKR